jgi:hypothetical protein
LKVELRLVIDLRTQAGPPFAYLSTVNSELTVKYADQGGPVFWICSTFDRFCRLFSRSGQLKSDSGNSN